MADNGTDYIFICSYVNEKVPLKKRIKINLKNNQLTLASLERQGSVDYTTNTLFTIFNISTKCENLSVDIEISDGLNTTEGVTFGNIAVYKACGRTFDCINEELDFNLTILEEQTTWGILQKPDAVLYSLDGINKVGVSGVEAFTLDDILQCQENAKRSLTGYFDICFNDKRKWIHNVKALMVRYGSKSFDVLNIKASRITRNADLATTIFAERAFSNVAGEFVCDTIRKHTYDSVYTAQKAYNDKYLLIKNKSFDGTYTEYSYNDYGSNTEERFYSANNNYPIKVSHEYSENGEFLNKEITYIENVKNVQAYTYDFQSGNLLKRKSSRDLVINRNYIQNATKLSSVEAILPAETDSELSKTNKNTIEYNGDCITSLSHSSNNANTAFTFSYDNRNNVRTISIANVAILTKDYQLSTDTDIVTTTYGNSQSIALKNDKYGRPISISSGDNDVTLTYIAPNVTQIKTLDDEFKGTVTSYTYDNNGNTTSVIETKDETVIYKNELSYDFKDRISTVKETVDDTIRTVTYIYANDPDDDNRLSETKVNFQTFDWKTAVNIDGYNRTVDITSGLFNKHIKSTLSYYDVTERTFVPGGEIDFNGNVVPPHWNVTKVGETSLLKEVNHYLIGETTSLLDTDTFTYDEDYNITSVTNKTNSIVNNKVSFLYDKLGRLIRENNKNLNKSFTYLYDCGGNILKKKEYAYTTGTLGEVLNEYDYSYKTSGWCDQLINVTKNGTSLGEFNYDNAGNPTQYKGKALQWTRGRLLERYITNRTLQPFKEYYTSYEYDGNGIRTKKTTFTNDSVLGDVTYTTEYVVSGSTILRERRNEPNEANSVLIDYIYSSDSLVGFVYNGTPYYYRKNIFGDIIAIYDQTNTKVGEYVYDVWGNCTITTNVNLIASINPFRYRGYYFDDETGFYYCNTRYYNPELGRWISPDSFKYIDPETINGVNLYCYCLDNPVSYVDPDGNLPQWAKWAIGIGVIALLAVVTVLTAGVAGVGVGVAFTAGFTSSAIGIGASGLAVTIAANAFAGSVITGCMGLVTGAIIGGISIGTWSGALDGAASGFMTGTITGAITGGIKGGIKYARTAPLIRSVSSGELKSIKSTGKFSSSGYSESKWFATNSSNASKWANWFNQTDYVGIRVPKYAFKNFYYNPFLDTIGPAYCIDIEYLNNILNGIWYF